MPWRKTGMLGDTVYICRDWVECLESAEKSWKTVELESVIVIPIPTDEFIDREWKFWD